jgi:hypothetical protein
VSFISLYHTKTILKVSYLTKALKRRNSSSKFVKVDCKSNAFQGMLKAVIKEEER